MELEQVLRMVGGHGETSYAKNSRYQARGAWKAKPILEEAIREVLISLVQSYLVVADLGCSSGPNTILLLSVIKDIVEKHCAESFLDPPAIQFFLNDLPSNDFNNIFRTVLPNFKEKQWQKKEVVPCYVAGLPGSFYGRLFPCRSVHFFHSCFSLMWLSQIPCGLQGEEGSQLNEGNIGITETGSHVNHLYFKQFKNDFSTFLQMRSKELVLDGRMVLTFLGLRNHPNHGDVNHMWRLMADALNAMVAEGHVEGDALNSFNMPYYTPSRRELESVILREGSFRVERMHAFELNWDPCDDSIDDLVRDGISSGENVAKLVRAGTEPLLALHFGEEIMDDLFARYAKNVAKHLEKEKARSMNFVLALRLK